MNKNRLELSVGIFMVIGLAAVAYLTLKLGAGSLIGGDSYLVESRFANAGGLHSGSNVQLAGVTIGRVEAVRIDPADFSAIATLRLRSGLRLPPRSKPPASSATNTFPFPRALMRRACSLEPGSR